MTTLKHNFTSPIVDDGDPDIVGPNEWNDDHVSDHPLVTVGAIPGSLTGARQLAVSGGLLSLTDAGAGGNITVGLTSAAIQGLGQALTRTNDTNVTLTLTGTPATALLQAVNIAVGWSGQLGLARGGTNADLSATGGTGQYLKQSSTGAAITVGTIASADLPGSFSGFANPSASIGLSVVNGSATTAMRSDAAPPLSQAIAPTWTALHKWTATLGVTPDDTAAGVQLLTSGTAALNAQQISPSVHFQGSGWKTNATAGAQTVDFREYLVPVQGGVNPTSYLLWERIAGVGGYSEAARLTSGGVFSPVTGFQINHANATAGHYLRGDGTNYVDSTIQSGDLPGSFSGFANPSVNVTLSVQNGSATTAMRSDAAPALSQAIVPTWTGVHTFTSTTVPQVVIDNSAVGDAAFRLKSKAASAAYVSFMDGTTEQFIFSKGSDNILRVRDMVNSVNAMLFVKGATAGLLSTAWFRLGSETTPTNVTSGDLTVERLIVPNQTLAALPGLVAVLSNSSGSAGEPTMTLSGVNNKERFEIRSFGASPAPHFQGVGAGGTVAAPTQTLINTRLLGLSGGGYDNAGTPAIRRNTGLIALVAGSAFTTTSQETYASIELVPSGSTTRAEYYRLQATGMLTNGFLNVGNSISPPTNVTPGDLTSIRYFNTGGRVDMLGGTSNLISFGQNGVAAPGTNSAGAKINLWGSYGSMGGASEYCIGIESNTMWFNSAGVFKLYIASTNYLYQDTLGLIEKGYLHVGSSISAPSNTTAGYLTCDDYFSFGGGVIFGNANQLGVFKAAGSSGMSILVQNTTTGLGAHSDAIYYMISSNFTNAQWGFFTGGSHIDGGAGNHWMLYNLGTGTGLDVTTAAEVGIGGLATANVSLSLSAKTYNIKFGTGGGTYTATFYDILPCKHPNGTTVYLQCWV